MAKKFWELPIDVPTWQKSLFRLKSSLAARGLFLEMLMYQWQEGEVPADAEVISRIAAAPLNEVKKLLPLVEKKFERREDVLVNAKMEEIRNGKQKRRKASARNGRLGGRPPKDNPEETQQVSGRFGSDNQKKPELQNYKTTELQNHGTTEPGWGFDGQIAFDQLVDDWPKQEAVNGARIVWSQEAVNNPNFEDWAKRALGIARKVRAADPSGDDLKYLPSLKRFLEERVDDDWDAKIASWRPAKRDLEAEMRAAVEAR